MSPDCIDITIARDTGLMYRLPRNILIDGSTRKDFVLTLLPPNGLDSRALVATQRKELHDEPNERMDGWRGMDLAGDRDTGGCRAGFCVEQEVQQQIVISQLVREGD
jgi:hypothetical protein